MATKALTADQHQPLHQRWPDNCCLCAAETRIKDLERERDEAVEKSDHDRKVAHDNLLMSQELLNRLAALEALCDAAADRLESEAQSLAMATASKVHESTLELIKRLREAGGE